MKDTKSNQKNAEKNKSKPIENCNSKANFAVIEGLLTVLFNEKLLSLKLLRANRTKIGMMIN